MEEYSKKAQSNPSFVAANQTHSVMLSSDMKTTVEVETVRNEDKEKRLREYCERLQKNS